MKKYILIMLSVLIGTVGLLQVEAKSVTNAEVTDAIKMYKAKNYAQSYELLTKYVEKDPSNALAYYYLAMSAAQIGNKSEAIDNYNKVIVITENDKLKRYAQKGKACLQSPQACKDATEIVTDLDEFIKRPYGSGFSEEARSEYEKHKIENFMREMNRNDAIAPQKFKEYKDFSSEVPTNDEIVAALRVLQRAGLTDYAGRMSEISMLYGGQNNNYNNNAMLNMLTGTNNSSVNSQMIQSLLTNQMSVGF